MIWQDNVAVIVMLCEEREQKKVKCASYWPRGTGTTQQHSHFTIQNIGAKDEHPLNTETIVMSKLRVTRTDVPQVATIQCQW